MLRSHKCSFCGHDIKRGTGQIYVKEDSSILRFCNRKCRISMTQHKRNPRRLKWTAKYERKY